MSYIMIGTCLYVTLIGLLACMLVGEYSLKVYMVIH